MSLRNNQKMTITLMKDSSGSMPPAYANKNDEFSVIYEQCRIDPEWKSHFFYYKDKLVYPWQKLNEILEPVDLLNNKCTFSIEKERRPAIMPGQLDLTLLKRNDIGLPNISLDVEVVKRKVSANAREKSYIIWIEQKAKEQMLHICYMNDAKEVRHHAVSVGNAYQLEGFYSGDVQDVKTNVTGPFNLMLSAGKASATSDDISVMEAIIMETLAIQQTGSDEQNLILLKKELYHALNNISGSNEAKLQADAFLEKTKKVQVNVLDAFVQNTYAEIFNEKTSAQVAEAIAVALAKYQDAIFGQHMPDENKSNREIIYHALAKAFPRTQSLFGRFFGSSKNISHEYIKELNKISDKDALIERICNDSVLSQPSMPLTEDIKKVLRNVLLGILNIKPAQLKAKVFERNDVHSVLPNSMAGGVPIYTEEEAKIDLILERMREIAAKKAAESKSKMPHRPATRDGL